MMIIKTMEIQKNMVIKPCQIFQVCIGRKKDLNAMNRLCLNPNRKKNHIEQDED